MSECEADPPVVREATVEELVRLLGQEAMGQLLAGLAQRLDELQEILRGMAPDPVSLRREAHALISQSGNLGFLQLSVASRDLCDSIRGHAWSDEAAACLAAVRDAAERARRELARRVPTA